MNEKLFLEIEEIISRNSVLIYEKPSNRITNPELVYNLGKIMGLLMQIRVDTFPTRHANPPLNISLREVCQSIVKCKFLFDKLPEDLKNQVIAESL